MSVDLDNSLIIIQGHGGAPASSAHPSAELGASHEAVSNAEPATSPKAGKGKEADQQQIFDLAGKILASAADKSSSEVEKKLIAAVMTVHMKYAESLSVIEKLIQDRKKIDDRVKFLESQLKKPSKKKDKQLPAEEFPPVPLFTEPKRLKKFTKNVDTNRALNALPLPEHSSSKYYYFIFNLLVSVS